MRQRDGLSWGRIATITGLPSSSICRTCTWDLEEIAPTACRGRITGTSGRPGSCVEQCYLTDNGGGYHLKNDAAAMAWRFSSRWPRIG